MNAEYIRRLLLLGDHMPLLRRHDVIQSLGAPVVDGLMDFFNCADDPGLPMHAAACDTGT